MEKISFIWENYQKHNLQLKIFDYLLLLNAIYFKTKSEYKTLITQEMLKKGYLASNAVYVCTEHSDVILKGYEEALDHVFGLIKECEQGKSLMTILKEMFVIKILDV